MRDTRWRGPRSAGAAAAARHGPGAARSAGAGRRADRRGCRYGPGGADRRGCRYGPGVLRRARREPSAILFAVQLAGVLLYPAMEGHRAGRALFSAFGILVLGQIGRAHV